MIQQNCTRCGKSLPISEFYKDPRRKEGVRTICKTCWSERQKDYRAKHKKEISESGKQYYKTNKERIAKRISNWRRENHALLMERQQIKRQSARELLVQLKTPCVKCGESKPWVIQFHHVVPTNKTFELSAENISHKTEETITEEVKKCVCLCANCHIEFHHLYGKIPINPEKALTEYLESEAIC